VSSAWATPECNLHTRAGQTQKRSTRTQTRECLRGAHTRRAWRSGHEALGRGPVGSVRVLAGTVATNAETTSHPIQPNQHFIGLVNGQHAGTVIYTICPGPPGGDGHPAADQSVSVRLVAAGGGDTGVGGDVIYARITPTTMVAMTRYGHPEPIPISAHVPCEGSGTIVFSSCPLPQPCGSGAAVDDVQVAYVDIAA